ncbi:MAG: carbohydrate ABC transporter permease [Kutzneria sp.]|nr:carbohydrate ABC transporter permease [Kutzneria sp.]
MLRIGVITLTLAWSAGPIVLAAVTSLSTQAEVNSVPPVWIPATVDFGSYRALLPFNASDATGNSGVTGQFAHALLINLELSVETVLLSLLVGLPAGFAFSRMRVPARGVLFGALIGTIVVPVFALIGPLFRMMASLHLIDTNPGLVLVYTTAVAPLGIWLFYNHCNDLPVEPQEAALIDGATWLQTLTRIVVPQLASAIAAITAILFLASWGQFLVPLLFAPTPDTMPATVLITQFVGKYATDYPLLSAAGMLTLLPPALVALFANRHIRGVLTGSH